MYHYITTFSKAISEILAKLIEGNKDLREPSALTIGNRQKFHRVGFSWHKYLEP